MRSPFQWTKFLSGDPKPQVETNAEYVDSLDSFPKDLSQESLPSPAFEPIVDDSDLTAPSAQRLGGKQILAKVTRALPTLRLPKLPSNRCIVTLSTEKDALRVVVFRGRKVVAWGSADPSSQTVPLETSPDENSPEIQKIQEEIAKSPLQSLLADLSIGRTKHVWSLLDKVGIRRGRTVMDLSLYTTLTRQLQIPKVKGRYLEPVVLSEVLETLPFGKDEVEVAWQIQGDDEDNSVFAVAMPKQRLNDQIMAAKKAGLAPAAAYSKSAALASVSGVLNGIVIHLEVSEAALVLVQDGNPKAVHQVEFGPDELNPETVASNLARAFGQVCSYFLPADPKQQDLDLPVILTGQTDATKEIAQLLMDKIQRRPLTINPDLSYPEDFPVEEYAINLGLFLTDQGGNSQGNKNPGQPPTLNLLPIRHSPSPLPVFQASVFVILLLLLIHPFNVVGKVDAKILEKESISRELQQLRAQERAIDIVLAGHQENQAALDEVSVQADELGSQLSTLQEEVGTLLEQLTSITGLASDQDITLTAVSPEGETFSLVGSAGSHAKALQYVLSLRDHPLFEDARLMQIDGLGGASQSNDTVVYFQITVNKLQPEVEEAEAEGSTSQ